MEGYHRFFIVGLLVIGLVGAHTENHEDHPAQKSVAEDTPRTLKKRSNSNLYGGMPRDEYEFTMNAALGVFEREAIVSAAARANYQRNNPNQYGGMPMNRPLDLSMGNPASGQTAEVERMRQNAQRSRDARRRQQEQRDDLIRRQLAQAAARLDALNQIYQQRQQQQPRPNPRGGPPRPSGSRRPGFRRL